LKRNSGELCFKASTLLAWLIVSMLRGFRQRAAATTGEITWPVSGSRIGAASLLTLLRQWWKVGRQQGVMHRDGWLFPGQHAMKPISTRQLYRIVVEAAQAADIAKRVGPHTLRHSFHHWRSR
jgi:integrase